MADALRPREPPHGAEPSSGGQRERTRKRFGRQPVDLAGRVSDATTRSTPSASNWPSWLQSLLRREVRIHTLQLINGRWGHPNPVRDHHPRQFHAIDQHDPGVDALRMLLRIDAEGGGGVRQDTQPYRASGLDPIRWTGWLCCVSFRSSVFFDDHDERRLVGMWESRVLCEISKSLWKPLWGFHSDVISTAVSCLSPRPRPEVRGGHTPVGWPIVVPGASYAVVVDRLPPDRGPAGLGAQAHYLVRRVLLRDRWSPIGNRHHPQGKPHSRMVTPSGRPYLPSSCLTRARRSTSAGLVVTP